MSNVLTSTLFGLTSELDPKNPYLQLLPPKNFYLECPICGLKLFVFRYTQHRDERVGTLSPKDCVNCCNSQKEN